MRYLILPAALALAAATASPANAQIVIGGWYPAYGYPVHGGYGSGGILQSGGFLTSPGYGYSPYTTRYGGYWTYRGG